MTKLWRFGSTLLLFGAAALPVFAQEGEQEGRREGPRENRREERRQQLLERFDKDGDGQLSEDERAAAREAFQERRERADGRPDREGRPGQRDRAFNPEQLFSRLDQNEDGKLSKDELGERGQWLARADANEDGEITKEEFQAGIARIREQAQRFDPEQLFSRLDENDDGKLSKEELGERGRWLARADANEDGEITKEEFQAGVARMRQQADRPDPEQLFSRLDQNEDGELAEDELRGPFAERLERADADEDGKISKKEFMAALERLRAQPQRQGPPDPEALFREYDENEDGKLTKDELPERIAGFLLRADADGDEAVTKDELQAARERLRARGEGRPRGEGRRGEDRPRGEDQRPRRPQPDDDNG